MVWCEGDLVWCGVRVMGCGVMWCECGVQPYPTYIPCALLCTYLRPSV